MKLLEKYLPSVLKWLLLIMFVIGLAVAALNFSYVSLPYSLGVIVFNLWGIYFVWRNGKLTKQSTYTQLSALAFFICSWQLILLYAYTGRYSLVTLLLTIAFSIMFAVTQFLEYRGRIKAQKEAEEKELARKEARAARKAAKKNNQAQ